MDLFFSFPLLQFASVLSPLETNFTKLVKRFWKQNIVLYLPNVTTTSPCDIRATAYLFPYPTCYKHSEISIEMLGGREGNVWAEKLSSYANKISSLHKNQLDFLRSFGEHPQSILCSVIRFFSPSKSFSFFKNN